MLTANEFWYRSPNMLCRWFLCVVVLSVFHADDASGQSKLSARQKKVVDEAVAQQMERQKAVGVAVGNITGRKSRVCKRTRL